MRESSTSITIDKKKYHRIILLTGLSVAAIILFFRLIYLYIGDPSRFPISTIKIIAPYRHVSHQQLENIISKYTEDSFFVLPVHKLYQDIMSLPWVSKIDIQRQWPDSIKINIKEKYPVAIWNGEILTNTGDTIKEETAIKEFALLPHLSGPVSNQRLILQMYQNINPLFKPINLKIDALFQRDNQAWEASLNNGIILKLGKKQTYERIVRFIKAYPLLTSNPEGVMSVDLRYPKGMAIQWKNPNSIIPVNHEK